MGPKPFPLRALGVSLRLVLLLGVGPASGAAQATGGEEAEPGVQSALQDFAVRAYRVTNDRLANKTVAELEALPREARVFADGYYVGIVNDFDGIFQHMNLEAGPHHIEIEMGGLDGIEFDVYVRPGETTTFRGDGYFRY